MTKPYITDNLYRAAAIQLLIGKAADEILEVAGTNKPKFLLKWTEVDTEVVRTLESGQAEVEPILFGKTHHELKSQILTLTDSRKDSVDAKRN